jgi:hypothetical protein
MTIEKIGAAWGVTFEDNSKEKFNLSIDSEKFDKLAVSPNGEVKLKIVKNETPGEGENTPSHSVYMNDYKPGDKRSSENETYINVNKAEFERLPMQEGGKNKLLESGPKKPESIQNDRANYWVRNLTKDDEKIMWGVDGQISLERFVCLKRMYHRRACQKPLQIIMA